MFFGALRGPLVNWRCRQCYVAEGKNLPEPVGVRQGCWLASAFLMTVPKATLIKSPTGTLNALSST